MLSFVTLPQAAQTLRLSWTRAYALLLTGQLRGELVAGRWRVDADSVAEFAKLSQEEKHS
jgi:hypothetical protein